MARFKWRQKSIVSRLTFLVVLVIVFQTLLLTATLIIGGVFEQAEQNAFSAFYDKVNNRKEFVQREVKNRWTNLTPYVNSIENKIKRDEIDSDQVFSKIMDQLIDMLRTTQVTGAYIILDQESINSDRHPALYLRDYDPLSNIYSDDDIYMLCGPSNLAKDYQIPLDQTWQYQLKMTEANALFYSQPYSNATIASKSNLMGYWSKPFKLSENDVPIITYSMPLSDANGNLVGVIGIEITLNYLTDFFPASELQPRDSLGYLIAYKTDETDDLEPIFTSGALQKRLIYEDSALVLSSEDSDQNIYEYVNHRGNEKIYACVEKLGLYQVNTPFEAEQWYLVGFMREDYLFSYVDRIKQILEISLLYSVILGVIGGAWISYQMTKPVINLAKQVRETDNNEFLHLKPTGLLELDELSQAIERANKMMLDSASRLSRIIEMVDIPIGAFEMNKLTGNVFVTDQFYEIVGRTKDEEKPFSDVLNSIFAKPEYDETDIYKIDAEPNRWIRLNITDQDDLVIGVVMDATGEILEKNEIKRDRDHDPLTQLLNRKGFQWRFEDLMQHAKLEVAAILMFDLDNLKCINDNYGHKWGDQYILKAVERLDDIADNSHKLLGRRSGDEFVLLLFDFDNKEALRSCVKTFFEQLPTHLIEFPDGSRNTVMISAGLMWIENQSLSYDELLHYADEALYESKRNRKGSVTESSY